MNVHAKTQAAAPAKAQAADLTPRQAMDALEGGICDAELAVRLAVLACDNALDQANGTTEWLFHDKAVASYSLTVALNAMLAVEAAFKVVTAAGSRTG